MKSTCAALSRLEENPPEDISDLSALEANRGASYFRSWVGVPIKWRGISRRPISENWHSIGQRSSPDHLAGNRNAAHPVNAILNYAYAALESEIRIKAIEIGATDGPNGGVWSVNLFAVPQTSTIWAHRTAVSKLTDPRATQAALLRQSGSPQAVREGGEIFRSMKRSQSSRLPFNLVPYVWF